MIILFEKYDDAAHGMVLGTSRLLKNTDPLVIASAAKQSLTSFSNEKARLLRHSMPRNDL